MTVAEQARHDLEAMMRSSPPPEGDEDLSNVDGNDNLESSIGSSPQHIMNLNSTWTSSSLRVEMDAARRLAAAKRLHPYQREIVEAFVKVCYSYNILLPLVIFFSQRLSAARSRYLSTSLN
jgi:hypothetical protein